MKPLTPFSSWPQVRDASGTAVALLPIGATEAHGPHLPLTTDGLIAEEIARRTAEKLSARGMNVWILPTLEYSPASYATNFSGTISLTPQTMLGLLNDIAASVRRAGAKGLCLISAHFDPDHVQTLHDWCEGQLKIKNSEFKIVYPDFTRRAVAGRLTEEFQKGSCHAGQFETSLIMAVKPDAIQVDRQKSLKANWVNLAEKIKSGVRTFAEAGCPEAYCGDPAHATAEEGNTTFEILAQIVCEEISS